jgi:hypothetical protein
MQENSETSASVWDWKDEFSDLPDDPVPALIDALGAGDIATRWKAAWALGHVGDSRAVEPLIEALNFSRGFVVGESEFTLNMVSAWALGRIGDFRAVDPLVQALDNQCTDFAWIAAWALGEIGDSRAIQPLVKALNREDFECMWSPGATTTDIRAQEVENAILDYIARTTYQEGTSPIERALQKLDYEAGKREIVG